MGGGILLIFLSLQWMGCPDLIWNMDMVPVCSFFMIVGHLYRRMEQNIKLEHNIYFILPLITIAVFSIWMNYNYFGHVDMLGNCYGNFSLFMVGALCAVYGLILLHKQISKSPRFLLFIGVNSLIYYGFHKMIIEVLFVLWGKCGFVFDNASWPSVGMAFVNVLIVSIILVPVCVFINNKIPWIIGKKK